MRERFKFRWPLLYRFLYSWVHLAFRLYYRRITVVGYEKIPSDTPVIFAPNHQNALMDAFAVDFASRRPLVFLARADIFKKPAIAKILNMLRILPIYRIRDGVESLGLNQEVFDNTVNVLNSNIPICILPEGNHEGKKRLRPLKKGIFRIAFQAEKSTAYSLNLHIIPVGIDYSDYYNAGSDLTVVFGTPIKIADYIAQYHDNEQKAINTMMKVLAENMRSVMIHIPEENYDLTYQICEMYEPNVWNTCNVNRHPYNKLTIRQYIAQKATEAFKQHPEKAVEIGNVLDGYNKNLSRMGITDCMLQQKKPRILLLLAETMLSILLLPLHLYGMTLNFIPLMFPVYISSKIKDLHFKSSIHFGISLFLFPVYYLLTWLRFSFFTDNLTIRLLFGISLPVSGFFAFYNNLHMKKLWRRLRVFSYRITKNKNFDTMYNDRAQIIDLIKTTLNS